MLRRKPVRPMYKEQRLLPEGFRLAHGASRRRDINAGGCLLEATAWIAGEAWTDTPICVSPVLAAFGRSLNDEILPADRQRLLPLAAELIGTAKPHLESARLRVLVDFGVREVLPAWLRAIGMPNQADAVLRLPADPITHEIKSLLGSEAVAHYIIGSIRDEKKAYGYEDVVRAAVCRDGAASEVVRAISQLLNSWSARPSEKSRIVDAAIAAVRRAIAVNQPLQ